MDYRLRRSIETEKLFAGFSPNVDKAKDPELILRVRDLAASGLFSKEIAEVVGKTQCSIQSMFHRYNFPSLHNFAPPLLGERPNWAGGTKLMKGYLYERSPGHPNGTKHGNYVAVHRLAMEDKLGRYLTKIEVVHHIDGNIKNNDPKNLGLFESNAAHLRETLKGLCPNWSEEGKKSLQDARLRPRRFWKGVAIEHNHD